jgi:hypothetical protein
VTVVRQITFSALCLATLAGCAAPVKEKPIWERVKLGDITPPEAASLDDQKLMVTDLQVLFFEIPADNIEQLNEFWPLMFRKPFKFEDEKAFAANSFEVGFGQGPLLAELDRFITQVEGVKGPVISLMLFDDQVEDVPVVPMTDATIFYISSGGAMEGVSVGPGALSLRLKVEKIPAARGIRRVVAVPAFKMMHRTGLRRPNETGAAAGTAFGVARFEVAMSPGDFFLLGPQRYIADQITLGSAFFSRPAEKPVVRLCIVLCARIDD